MDADQVAALRALLAPTGWTDRTLSFARALRRSARTPHGLLIIGPTDDEPWHMTAHLIEESRLAGLPELAPTFVRLAPPANAPAHLSIGVERLRAATRQETLLVVSSRNAPDELLERVHDVRRAGATIFALDQDDPRLDELAHESLAVRPDIDPLSFDAAQHLVSSAVVADTGRGGHERAGSHRASRSVGRTVSQPGIGQQGQSLRGRLARLLDAVSGTPPD